MLTPNFLRDVVLRGASCLALAAMLMGSGALAATTLYVAPGGNDAWDGATPQRRDGTAGPLASLEGARNALRRLRTEGKLQAPIRVLFADGEYALEKPVTFEPQDSGTSSLPVTFAAAPGAKPRFTGGRRITGWKAVEGGLWRAEVPPVWRFEALWVNGQRATRARTPNLPVPEGPAQGEETAKTVRSRFGEHLRISSLATEAVPGVPLAGPLERTALMLKPAEVAPLKGLSPEDLREAQVLLFHTWDVSRHRIAGINFDDGTLQFTGPGRASFILEDAAYRLRLENYRAALDQPGEWFLDRQGGVLYQPRPGEKLETAEIYAPVAPKWLEIKGDAETGKWAEHLTFHGLEFRHQIYQLPAAGVPEAQADSFLGAAVEVEGARHISFERCEFAHTGTYALWFRRGVTDSRAWHCHFHDLGAGGVRIGDTAVPKTEALATHHITVEDSILHGGGRYFPSSVGVLIIHSSDNLIRHNDIADFYYTGISVGWVWGFKPSVSKRNRIEWNHIHHLGWGSLSDMAGVYTLGPSEGTVVRHNHIHDVAGYTYGGWGIYADEGTTGILWENNLVYRAENGGWHQHYGRESLLRNNIFAFGREVQLRHSRIEEHTAFFFTGNIVLWDEGQLLGMTEKAWTSAQTVTGGNWYWPLKEAKAEFFGQTLEAWQKTGQESGSQVADPGLVAPLEDDFHFRADSAAVKAGFVPFPYEQAGVTGGAEWKALAAVVYPRVSMAEDKIEQLPRRISENFEAAKVAGDRMGALYLQDGGKVESLQVVESNAAEGKRCLQLADSPELKPGYTPHIYAAPRHRSGTSVVSFALRMDAGAVVLHEWRDSSAPYRTGPEFRIERGALSVAGKKVADFPAGEWIRVEMESAVGPGSKPEWTLTLIRAGQPAQKVEHLPHRHKEMQALEWVGFISPGTKPATYWLDDLKILTR